MLPKTADCLAIINGQAKEYVGLTLAARELFQRLVRLFFL